MNGGLFTGFGLPLTIRLMRCATCLVVLAVLLAGCGYRGPLVLPKDKPEAQKPAPKPAQEPADKKPGGDQ